MADQARICVVGSANVDLTFRTPRFPRPGETLAGHAFQLGMGGKGANQAVAAVRLGALVTFVARVGNDAFGVEALRSYQAEGLDTAFVVRDADQPTGTAAILVDDAAENAIVVVAGANSRLSAADVQAAASAIQTANAVLCQLETPFTAASEAFQLARRAGRRTILTPAPAIKLPTGFLQLCDLCVPNETELQLLTGQLIASLGDAESAAKKLRDDGVGTVVVTLGSRGALVVDDGGATHIPPVSVVAVDPTGAGDAFTAALAVALAEGMSLHAAARRASAVAALTVTKIGTQTAFPRRADVEQFLAAT